MVEFLKELLHMTAHGFHVLTSDGTLHNKLKEKLPLKEKNISVSETRAEVVPNNVQGLSARDIKGEKSHDFRAQSGNRDGFDYFDFVMNHNNDSVAIVGTNHLPIPTLERGQDVELLKKAPQDLFAKPEPCTDCGKGKEKRKQVAKAEVSDVTDIFENF